VALVQTMTSPGRRRDRRGGLRRAVRAGSLVAFALAAAACGESPSTLDPKGPAAARLADVWWFIFFLASVVFVAVMAFLVVGLFRSSRPSVSGGDTVAGMSHTTFIILAGAAVPFVILVVLFVYTLRTMAYFSESPEEPVARIEVIGWMWWWEVRYPDEGIVTANEIRIPAGEYIEIRTTGADVIHAVWPSQLAGKIDSTPGEWNTLWLRADEPGVYRGQCAEYCGDQHTNMDFLIIAEPFDEYLAWVVQQQRQAVEPAPAAVRRGQEVFQVAQCGLCHAIQGTAAAGIVGPDLTHLANRMTIASALIPNTRENLRDFVVNPHAVKPGVKMPPSHLSEDDLNALLDYLETLE
jgi:cytochrome c oxidase subunit II